MSQRRFAWFNSHPQTGPIEAPMQDVLLCKTLAEALLSARKSAMKRGITNKSLAKALRMSPGYLSEIVTGAKDVPEDWQGGKDFVAAFSAATGTRIAEQWLEVEEARKAAAGPQCKRERVDLVSEHIDRMAQARGRILEEAADGVEHRREVYELRAALYAVEAESAAKDALIAELRSALAKHEAARHGLIDRRAS